MNKPSEHPNQMSLPDKMPSHESLPKTLHLRLVTEDYRPDDTEFDGGDGGGGGTIRVTFSGEAAQDIHRAAWLLKANAGDFIRRSVKLGIAATEAAREGKEDLDFNFIFIDDKLGKTDQ